MLALLTPAGLVIPDAMRSRSEGVIVVDLSLVAVACAHPLTPAVIPATRTRVARAQCERRLIPEREGVVAEPRVEDPGCEA